MYKVGTRLLSYTDESRKESLGPKEGPRYVGVRLYYPAKVENEKLFEIEGKTYGECYECPEFAEAASLSLSITMAIVLILNAIITYVVNWQRKVTLLWPLGMPTSVRK